MKHFTSIGLALALFVVAGCSEPQGSTTPTPEQDTASSAPQPSDDTQNAFNDGFESGDSSEWKEGEAEGEKTEDDETEDEEPKDET